VSKRRLVITAVLTGVTRDSVLRLAARLGLRCEEGRISVAQWRKQCEAGLITEVFACGTAAVIAPVGQVRGSDGGWTVGDGNPGRVTLRLRDELLGIQYGRIPDELRWLRTVCRPPDVPPLLSRTEGVRLS